MKHLKLIIVCISLFATSGTFAQKIGFVNMQQLLEAHPAYDTIKYRYQETVALYEEEMQKMMDNYQIEKAKLDEKLNAPGPKVNAIIERQQKKVDDLYARIQQFNQEANAELQEYLEEMMLPLKNEIKAIVKAVAKEKGYSQVLDNSLDIVVYAAETDDLQKAVLARFPKSPTNPARRRF